MKVTIHQANYFPYPGFFQKISLSDIFVVLDKTQFQFDITNRNKIISPNGSWTRISVPIKNIKKFTQIFFIINQFTFYIIFLKRIYKPI